MKTEKLFTQLVKAVASEVADELEARNVFKTDRTKSESSLLRLNTKQASTHYGVDPRTIRRWIDRKIIRGEKIGNRYMVYVEQEKLGS